MDKISLLAKYLPQGTAPIISRWIDYYQCEFKISRKRSSKYGDYRAPFKDSGHRISVNFDLNPYAFLVTTVHEFAHLLTWNEHKRKAKPHGAEWKVNFKKMMKPFFEAHSFPADVQAAIVSYLQNPSASSCSDLNLFRVLRSYDANPEVRIRKRYRCVEVKSGAVYLFSPLAEVTALLEAV
jgi:SprT protein